MRQIVLDTETTGLEPQKGHRIIEIACVELKNRRLTGQHLHFYINPEREIDKGAFAIHGLSQTFLQDKPLFKDIVNPLLQFIESDELIIHNAPFDLGFLAAEWKRLEKKYPPLDKNCAVIDTLSMARRKHPGQRNSLDALCQRYNVDNSKRDLHGALLDAEILAQVYLAMTRGQDNLFADNTNAQHYQPTEKNSDAQTRPSKKRGALPVIYATEEEAKADANYFN